MRCSCTVCGTYMVHAESQPGCVCPDCLARCKACLGTDTVIQRDAFRNLQDNPLLVDQILWEPEPFEEKFAPDEYGRE